MSRSAALRLLSALALLALGACRSPCRDLSELLCECQETTTDKERCLQDVSSAQSRYEPEQEDEDRCEPLVDKCRAALELDNKTQNRCKELDTNPDLKAACGLTGPTAAPLQSLPQ